MKRVQHHSGQWFVVLVILGMCFLPLGESVGQTAITTRSGNSQRTGANINEPYLNASNVNVNFFGKLYASNVDGFIIGQPLYVPGVSIPGQGVHNVVYVATQHDSVYAFDADTYSQLPLWYVNFTNPLNGITSVPIANQGCPKVTMFNEVGIMGTPAIDLATGTIYLASKTKEVVSGVTAYAVRLHALDIASGQEKFNGPTVINGRYLGPNGVVTFDPLTHMQRPGLLLANGNVYLAFGSNGCGKQARGWVLGYNAADLTQQVGVFTTAPSQQYGASVWMSGAGLASDDEGAIYFSTADGLFNADKGGQDYGDSILKLVQQPTSLTVGDFFTPFNQATLNANDLDLGSGGVLLLPDQAGTVSHELATAGKNGTIYLLNRDNLGHYNSTGDTQVVQAIPAALGELHGSPVLWNDTLYFSAEYDSIKGYTLTNGLLSTTPEVQSKVVQPNGTPVISANGNSNGLLWLVRSQAAGGGLFSAFNASTLAELYTSIQNPTRDAVGTVPHFATPMVANGKVYVGGQTQLVVYGLLPNLITAAGDTQTSQVNTILPSPLSLQVRNPYTGNGIPGTAVSCSDGGAGGSFASITNPTDSFGMFSTNYTLPKAIKSIRITCAAAGDTPASFTANAVAGSVSTLAQVSGSNQSARVGNTLANPLVVKAKDAYLNPVAGVSVTFGDANAGGSFFPNPAITNSQGLASVSYTVPTAVKRATITANTAGLAPTSFVETSTAGVPALNAILSGNNQKGAIHSQLKSALLLVVKDSYGNPVPNVTVTFSDNGAGGTFSSSTAITDTMGRAAGYYTTPGVVGTVTISGGVSGVAPAVFTETVQ